MVHAMGSDWRAAADRCLNLNSGNEKRDDRYATFASILKSKYMNSGVFIIML